MEEDQFLDQVGAAAAAAADIMAAAVAAVQMQTMAAAAADLVLQEKMGRISWLVQIMALLHPI